MDVFKQACPPQDNPLSIPMALTHHHFSECTMQTSVHFSSVRGMEQLKEKQEQFYAARQQRIQLQQGKLRKVNDLLNAVRGNVQQSTCMPTVSSMFSLFIVAP